MGEWHGCSMERGGQFDVYLEAGLTGHDCGLGNRNREEEVMEKIVASDSTCGAQAAGWVGWGTMTMIGQLAEEWGFRWREIRNSITHQMDIITRLLDIQS